MWNKSLHYSGNDTLHTAGVNTTTVHHQAAGYLIPVQLVVALYILILVVGLIGNTLVVLVILHKPKMQTFTNCMIVNLAVADLLVALICIPLEIPLEVNDFKWIYGKFFCSVFYPIETATVYGSVFTLVVLSCSRYRAVVHPFRKLPTATTAKMTICVIWMSGFLLVLPYMVALKYESEEEICKEVWEEPNRRTYILVVFVTQYALPLAIIIPSYTFIILAITVKKDTAISLRAQKVKQKREKNLVKLLLVLTVTFTLCVLPCHALALAVEFSDANSFKYINDVGLASYILLYLNSALNPVIYNAFSSGFREAFNESYKKFTSRVMRRNASESNAMVRFHQQQERISVRKVVGNNRKSTRM